VWASGRATSAATTRRSPGIASGGIVAGIVQAIGRSFESGAAQTFRPHARRCGGSPKRRIADWRTGRGVSIGKQRGTQGCVTLYGGYANLATHEAVGPPEAEVNGGNDVPHSVPHSNVPHYVLEVALPPKTRPDPAFQGYKLRACLKRWSSSRKRVAERWPNSPKMIRRWTVASLSHLTMEGTFKPVSRKSGWEGSKGRSVGRGRGTNSPPSHL